MSSIENLSPPLTPFSLPAFPSLESLLAHRCKSEIAFTYNMIPTGTLSVAYSIIQAGKYKILKAEGAGKLPVGTVVLCNKGRSKMERYFLVSQFP